MRLHEGPEYLKSSLREASETIRKEMVKYLHKEGQRVMDEAKQYPRRSKMKQKKTTRKLIADSDAMCDFHRAQAEPVLDRATHTLPGGATRSRVLPFGLVPTVGIRRITQRFALGAIKHGENNWKSSIQKREDAKVFVQEAWNHAMEHMLKLSEGSDLSDDHIGAIGWFSTVCAEVERVHGCRIEEL